MLHGATGKELPVIYTVTLNPALDYLLWAPPIREGRTNRSEREEIHFGGKGINVSLVLRALGQETCALGFVGGFTGEALKAALEKEGVLCRFVALEGGMTRINVKLKTDVETEINARGPEVSSRELEALLAEIDQIGAGDTLVLAGSVPGTLPGDVYCRILDRLSGKDVRVAVDAEGDVLRNTLRYRPFLIKPNRDELSLLAGRELRGEKEILAAAKDLQGRGARNVLVSLGGEGAILLAEDGKVHTARPHAIVPVNTVGAGDSMVAGFLAGCDRGPEYALRLGNAAGAACASALHLAQKEDVFRLLGEDT